MNGIQRQGATRSTLPRIAVAGEPVHPQTVTIKFIAINAFPTRKSLRYRQLKYSCATYKAGKYLISMEILI
jgi:hypothetical protein